MSRRSMTGTLLALIVGAVPLGFAAAASAQDLRAHCASVDADDRVRRLPAALVPAARRLFGPGFKRARRGARGEHGLSMHERPSLALQHWREPDMRQRRRPPRIQRRRSLVQGSSELGRRAHGRHRPRHDLHVDVRRQRAAHRAGGKARSPRLHRRAVGASRKIELRTRPVRNTVRGPDPVVQVSDESGACHAATRRSNRS